jgi:hypothetical protein
MNKYVDVRIAQRRTVKESVTDLSKELVGHRIVEVLTPSDDHYDFSYGTMIVLDNGKRVVIENTSDCCAHAEVLEFLFNADKVDHIITDVSLNSGEYEINILADMDDVLALRIRWGEGSGYGYSFGFKIKVKELNPEWVKLAEMENQALAELREAGYEV